MRNEIATYLQQGFEGKFYYRVVDTVLARDKNWALWKAEGCPLIERTAVSADDFLNSQRGAQKACANKRLRATPVGSLDLKFLTDGENADGLEKLKNPERQGDTVLFVSPWLTRLQIFDSDGRVIPGSDRRRRVRH